VEEMKKLEWILVGMLVVGVGLSVHAITYAIVVDKCLRECNDLVSLEVKRLWSIPKEIKCTCQKNESYPVKSYTLGLASFPWKWLCDFQFTEYSDGRVEVKKLSCIEFNKEVAETLTERFLVE